MQVSDGRFSASPTDLANFLACRHKTSLDVLVAEGRLRKPTWSDPFAEVLRRRGDEHERHYVETLRAQGLSIVDLNGLRDASRESRVVAALDAMRGGADVIVQAALTGDGWLGYADVLRRVEVPSALGGWSYEAQDTKLARETRGGTMVQLCVYSDLIAELQGRRPERFHVITPASHEPYRFDDFGAFYRQTRTRFGEFVAAARGRPAPETYPERVEHCDVCRWRVRCDRQRRADDDLSFVAGIARSQITELKARGVATLAALASLAVPLEFTPLRGAKETFARLREQARLQAEQRQSLVPVYELLDLDKDFGLTQLPEPRPGDLFLDLEGDMFGRPGVGAGAGETAREYLFGLARVGGDGSFHYTARWAFTDAEERAAFEAVMDAITAALAADEAVHVFHYAAYEPAAFKRLAGRHATREQDLDRLLRGGRFVDLYSIARHAVRCGVESYSIKALEPFYGFRREIELDEAGHERRLVEIALETGDHAFITPAMRAAVEGYNRDDCRSTRDLRGWLESLRQRRLAAGDEIPRPPLEPSDPPEEVSARQQRVEDLRRVLIAGVPEEPRLRSPDQQARHLIAWLLDWHYREDKVVWWEYFRLRDLSDDDLLDERAAVSRLEYVGRMDLIRHKKTGRPTGSVVDRYRFPPQECDLGPGDHLDTRDEKAFGTVVAVDRRHRTIDVKKGPTAADSHPGSAFCHERFDPDVPANSVFRLGEQIAAHGLAGAPPAAVDLLCRRTGVRGHAGTVHRGEPTTDYAVRIVGDLTDVTLPIQGPPGSGKTYTGARMICELVAAGHRVGVTATGHKVIRNLLDAVDAHAAKRGQTVRLGHKINGDSDRPEAVREFGGSKANADALAAIRSSQIDVLGGTAWLWGQEDFAGSVDVLFVDEAGQMSLANALAVSQAARTVVLLGDPQQLEQPQKGSHPPGVDVSALDHVLEGHATMPAERGLFLPITWRLAPAICRYTSALFYEGKLAAKPGLEHQRLEGAGRFDGAGLFVVPVDHDGCRNASDEEAEQVHAIVTRLLQPGVNWVDETDRHRPLTARDILVVAPYNAHVARIAARLRLADAGGATATGGLGDVAVGTVDKFQGQEAPVVIYSMATSRPEDAPRGMEFLYSLNRLNVATSRARCACILVLSPRLFEPDCRTPRQMRLANGLATLREFAGAAGLQRGRV